MSTLTAPKEKISLTEINPNEKTIAKSFGISDARRDELCEVIEKNFEKKNSTVVQDMVNIAKETTSHEELAFAMVMYGCHMAQAEATPLQSLLSALERRN